MKDLTTLNEEFETLNSLVRRAIDDWEGQGQTVDMSVLGLKAVQLCGAVENSKPEIAHQLKPIMAQLIQDLDQLAALLEQQEKGS